MREPTEIRQSAAMRVYAVFLCLLYFLFVGMLLVPHGIGSGSEALFTLFFGVVWVAFIARSALLKILADQAGLHVRNFFRTQHFRWEEVEDFRLGRPMSGLPLGWVIYALLRNGEVVTLEATSSNWRLVFGGRARAEQFLNTLREWLPPRN
jgi:Bacterial PH domain